MIRVYRNLPRSDRYFKRFGYARLKHVRTVRILWIGPLCVTW
jgi:hypothetical protein